MAEIGLLPFARIALQVSKAVPPRYRSRFDKHQFMQHQLLAILCLMRYEDWTFRDAEVRLGEHRELRQALGLTSVPDFTILYRFLQRLDDQIIDQAVGETVRYAAIAAKDYDVPALMWTPQVWARSGQYVLRASPAPFVERLREFARIPSLLQLGSFCPKFAQEFRSNPVTPHRD